MTDNRPCRSVPQCAGNSGTVEADSGQSLTDHRPHSIDRAGLDTGSRVCLKPHGGGTLPRTQSTKITKTARSDQPREATRSPRPKHRNGTVNRRQAKPGTCRRCGAPVLRGEDHDRIAAPATVNPEPVTRHAEVAAILTGRTSYNLIRGALHYREPTWTAGKPSRHPIHLDHTCTTGGHHAA